MDEQKGVNLIEKIFDSLDEIEGTDEEKGLELFAALLDTPDEYFETIAPTLLESFENTFNTPEAQLTFSQMLNINGIKYEDLVNSTDSILEIVNEQFDAANLSQIKKDFIAQFLTVFINSLAQSTGIPKRVIEIPIERCHPDAKLPEYANLTDSGMDVYALEDYEILPGEKKLIPTGLKVAIPNGYELQVRPKSGRALKTWLHIANSPGTIDAGYRDEIGIIIENLDPPIKDIEYDFNDDGTINIKSILHGAPYEISKGSKFCQLVLMEVPKCSWREVDKISDEGDRGGGFGSTGLS